MENEHNGRVTLALLQREVRLVEQEIALLRADLTTYLDRLNDTIRDSNARLTELEICNARNDERWTAHREQHTRENGITALFGAIASALSAFAGIFISKP